MKKITKKLLSVFLAALFAMSAFAVNASALWPWDETEDEFDPNLVLDNIIYYLDNEVEEAIVSYYETDDEGVSLVKGSVTIPETVSAYGTDYTVTIIDAFAFASCTEIEEIILPSTITQIGDSAFADTPKLKKAVIPASCHFDYFGDDIFSYSPAYYYLAENAVDGEVIIGQNVLFSYFGSDSVYTVSDEITIITDKAFFMSDVEEVNLNENIKDIRSYTFANCANLKAINGTQNLETIDTGAFSYCSSLEEIKLGDELLYISEKAFEGTKIKEIYLGAAVYDVSGAFFDCKTIEKITVSEENERYFMDGDALYYQTVFPFEDYGVIIPTFYSVEYFIITSDATSFKAIEGTEHIGSRAFYNCKQLKSFDFSDCDMLDIYDGAFENCSFESFDFSNVYGIYEQAFRNCKGLTDVDLSNVTYIGASAFENCTSLSSVKFGNDISSIDGRAFAGTALETVNIGGDQCEVYESAFMNCKNLKRVNFNEGVQFIDTYMFTNCPALERVYIADSVEVIAEGAFDTVSTQAAFEVIKYSVGYDYAVENGLNYEIVGKVPFFTRVARWFNNLFDKLFGWMIWYL